MQRTCERHDPDLEDNIFDADKPYVRRKAGGAICEGRKGRNDHHNTAQTEPTPDPMPFENGYPSTL